MAPLRRLIFAALTTLALHGTTTAAPIQILLESDDDAAGGSEIFGANFDSLEDLLNANIASSGFSQLSINQNFSIGGFAYDGQYRLLLESDQDEIGGSEVFSATFDTYQDLLDANISSSGFSQLSINQNFSIGGFAYDGSYRLILESDDDEIGGSEVFGATFDTYQDLLDAVISSSGFSQLSINQNFSIGGFAYDGMYQLLLESNEDEIGGSELFNATFATYQDFLDANIYSSGFSQLSINQNFSTRGMVALADNTDPPSPVSEPGSLALLGLGLIGLGMRRASGRGVQKPA